MVVSKEFSWKQSASDGDCDCDCDDDRDGKRLSCLANGFEKILKGVEVKYSFYVFLYNNFYFLKKKKQIMNK